jgi:hypothetical protein
MSLYIHRENIQLLWSIIQKNPLIAKIQDPETWFHSFIQTFSEKAQYVPMNASSLNQLNRQTLAAMVEDLKNGRANQSVSEPTLPLTSGSKERIAAYEEQFKQRQLEYQPIKPILPEVNFSEKIDDEAITNMDELIKKQIEMRNNDVVRALENMPPPPQPVESIRPVKQSGDLHELRTMVLDLQKTVQQLQSEIEIIKSSILPSATTPPINI